MECTEDLLSHLDLLIREIYLPMLGSPWGQPATPASKAPAPEGERAPKDAGREAGRSELVQGNRNVEKMNELLHKILSSVDVAYGHTQGSLLLPMPNTDLLMGLMHPPSSEDESLSPEGAAFSIYSKLPLFPSFFPSYLLLYFSSAVFYSVSHSHLAISLKPLYFAL